MSRSKSDEAEPLQGRAQKRVKGSGKGTGSADCLAESVDASGIGATAFMGDETCFLQQINKRECIAFVSLDGTSDPSSICGCGYPRLTHTAATLTHTRCNVPWQSTTHTQLSPTDAYGQMEFLGFKQKFSQYIRLDVDTPTSLIMELLTEVWAIHHPDMLISVTGGEKAFDLKPRIRQMFRNGLRKIAKSNSAWIVSGGMYSGVMRLVGEAVSDYDSTNQNSVAIGIAPWGCVQNRASLLNANREGQSDAAQYRIESDDLNESPLDPNHTHFIFVDDGTIHQFGSESNMRMKLEEAVASSTATACGGDKSIGVKVPMVMVVLEGGPDILETVHMTLQKGTPVVVVDGSGRAADILAYAYLNAHKTSMATVVDTEGKQSMRTEIAADVNAERDSDLGTVMGIAADVEAEIHAKIAEEFAEADMAKWVGWVKESIVYYDLLTVFHTDSNDDDKDLDISILNALLKGNKEQYLVQLHMALSWDRIDVAKSEIFVEDREWKTGELDDLMMSAILLDRVKFIDLFLDNGVSLKQFLTVDVLLNLYNQIPKKCVLYSLLCKVKKDSNRHFINLEDVGRLIKDLIGEFYEPLYLDPEFAGEQEDDADIIRRPERELFVWSLLMNRQEMSLYFWNNGKDPLCAALFANTLLTAMRDQTYDIDVKAVTEEHAKTYAELALGVLTECHSADEKRARTSLLRQLNFWGKTTSLDLAFEGQNKPFIAHPACQSLLNGVWYSNLSYCNSYFLILLATIFPPFLFLLKYVKYPGSGEGEENEESVSAPPSPKHKHTAKAKPHADTKDAHNGKEKLASADENEVIEMNSPATKVTKTHGDPLLPAVRVQSRGINPCQKVVYFFQAPVVRFSYNVLFYMAFLLLYSYLLLVVYKPEELPHVVEYIIIVWVATMIVEEVRQFITGGKDSFTVKMKNYISDTWNVADVITILVFLVGIGMRVAAYYEYTNLVATGNSQTKKVGVWRPADCGKQFKADEIVLLPTTLSDASRVVFAVNIVTFYIRLLHIFSINKNLGPKLVMISQMVVDLLYFFVIILVFVTAYGIAITSLRYPNGTKSIFVRVFYMSYFAIFGDIDLSKITVDEVSNFIQISMGIFLALYMLVINVMILNLLIAMFSYTFQRVQDDTDNFWCFQRFTIISEYYDRPALPPPLIFFGHIYRCCKYVCCGCKTAKGCGFSQAFGIDMEGDQGAMTVWEDVSRDEYNRKQQEKEEKSVDYQVTLTSEKMDQLQAQNEQLRQMHKATTPAILPGPTDGSTPNKVLGERLKRLEEHLNYVVKALVDNNLACKDVQPPDAINVNQAEEDAEREREMVKKMVEKRVEIHVKSRASPYPGSKVRRAAVSDAKVPWEISYPDYYPINYTATKVLNNPIWADHVDLFQCPPTNRPTLAWHSYDDSLKIDRTSYMGQYAIREGLPINPNGRTGMVGRGLLGRWGPNHAGDPIVTRYPVLFIIDPPTSSAYPFLANELQKGNVYKQRYIWKRDPEGNQVLQDGKPLLEFAAIQRQDNKEWSFPGGFCAPGEFVIETLKEEFIEEMMGSDHGSEVSQAKLAELFSGGDEVFRGYADDPRNTDNAWIETRVVHYHDDSGETLKHFALKAGQTEVVVTWLTASSKICMHSSHQFFMQKVAQRMNCAF